MTSAYINRIASVVPSHDVHGRFVEFARTLLGKDEQRSARFERMVEVAGIAHRYSCLDPDSGF